MSRIIVSDDWRKFLDALPSETRRKLSFHDFRKIKQAIPDEWLKPSPLPDKHLKIAAWAISELRGHPDVHYSPEQYDALIEAQDALEAAIKALSAHLSKDAQ